MIVFVEQDSYSPIFWGDGEQLHGFRPKKILRNHQYGNVPNCQRLLGHSQMKEWLLLRECHKFGDILRQSKKWVIFSYIFLSCAEHDKNVSVLKCWFHNYQMIYTARQFEWWVEVDIGNKLTVHKRHPKEVLHVGRNVLLEGRWAPRQCWAKVIRARFLAR